MTLLYRGQNWIRGLHNFKFKIGSLKHKNNTEQVNINERIILNKFNSIKSVSLSSSYLFLTKCDFLNIFSWRQNGIHNIEWFLVKNDPFVGTHPCVPCITLSKTKPFYSCYRKCFAELEEESSYGMAHDIFFLICIQ